MKLCSNLLTGIVTAGQIVVKPILIRNSASKIKTLSSTVKSRRLSVEFAYSDGEVVKELKEYAEKLKATGDAIALVMQQTAVALDDVAKQFKTIDESIAEKILKGKSE